MKPPLTNSVDEATILNILTNHSNKQRQDIAFSFQRRAKKELASALTSASSGHLEMGPGGLLKHPLSMMFQAKGLHERAGDGRGLSH